MVRKNLGLDSEKTRQTTILDFLFLNNSVCRSNSPKPQFRQAKLTDFNQTIPPKQIYIEPINTDEFLFEPLRSETKIYDELMFDLASAMIETCLNRMIEEKQNESWELTEKRMMKLRTMKTKQTTLYDFSLKYEIIEIENSPNFTYDMKRILLIQIFILFYNFILKYYYNKITFKIKKQFYELSEKRTSNPLLKPSEYSFRTKRLNYGILNCNTTQF